METAESTVPKFYLGICMAGAVSAGAYTAGVMDYLLEALTAYEKLRGQPGIPSHKVEIPAIGGASAGGMTSIITAAALQQGINPIDQPAEDLLAERPENILYHSWVDLTDRDMFTKMLAIDDIESSVASALNCKFIDEVARRTITPKVTAQTTWQQLPSFFPDRLKLFTTLSNLEGFTYDVNFVSADATQRHPYYMKFHNDYACFEMTRGNVVPEGKGWMHLDIEKGENAKIAIQAAMATGAFPVGLKARTVSRSKETVLNNPLMDENILKSIVVTDETYVSLNVDGGMINNEPFDKVRELLIKASGQSDEKAYENYQKFNSTVLMIAPFPSTKPNGISLADKLLNVVGLTLSAMISQMRSKPWQVKEANDPDCAGQFLIDPSRTFIKKHENGQPLLDDAGLPQTISISGEKAIACGALDGFSGFLNKEFRVHDYFLGRYNCKIFLRDYFTIPDKDKEINPVFSKGYEGITGDRFRGKDGSWQIIPIVSDIDYDFPKLNFVNKKDWPVQDWSEINKYDHPLRKRVEAVIMNVTKYKTHQRILIWPGIRLFIRGMVAKSILKTIRQELTAWNLIK
jgi:hypothetical protein